MPASRWRSTPAQDALLYSASWSLSFAHTRSWQLASNGESNTRCRSNSRSVCAPVCARSAQQVCAPAKGSKMECCVREPSCNVDAGEERHHQHQPHVFRHATPENRVPHFLLTHRPRLPYTRRTIQVSRCRVRAEKESHRATYTPCPGLLSLGMAGKRGAQGGRRGVTARRYTG